MSGSHERWLEENRAFWDERVPIHLRSGFYDVVGFRAGRAPLPPFEIEEVGEVAGKDLLHLQCHFGLDTLSWARRGARVVGLDFSPAAVEAARSLAADTGLEAEFVCANVYEAPEALPGRSFDVVYTGTGALDWLPDLGRWAEAIAGLLRPGGFLYLAEFHPVTWIFADEDLTVRYDYFRKEGVVSDEPGTYADPDAQTAHDRTHEWNHPLGEVITAIIEAGLRLEMLNEHDHTLFRRWPFLVETEPGVYRLPEGMPSLPLMYSLRAGKPATAPASRPT